MVEPIARPIEEPVGDSPAARGTHRGRPRGRRGRGHRGVSRRGALSQPPPELTRMDASVEEVFGYRSCKQGISRQTLWMKSM